MPCSFLLFIFFSKIVKIYVFENIFWQFNKINRAIKEEKGHDKTPIYFFHRSHPLLKRKLEHMLPHLLRMISGGRIGMPRRVADVNAATRARTTTPAFHTIGIGKIKMIAGRQQMDQEWHFKALEHFWS